MRAAAQLPESCSGLRPSQQQRWCLSWLCPDMARCPSGAALLQSCQRIPAMVLQLQQARAAWR